MFPAQKLIRQRGFASKAVDYSLTNFGFQSSFKTHIQALAAAGRRRAAIPWAQA
jgi:hypothetical protein